MKKFIILTIVIIIVSTYQQNYAIGDGENYSDNKIWEKIFKIISDNTNSDPSTWIKNQLGVAPVFQKGNRHILGHDYFLLINYSSKEPQIYLENERIKPNKILLKPHQIYILSDKGIVKNMDEGYFILIYDVDWIFLIDIEENVFNRILIPSKT